MPSKKENILNQLLSSPQRQQFEQMLAQLRNRPAKIEDWSSIHSPDKSMQADYNFLEDSSNCSENFSRLVIGKLNGGLGTSMGCAGPKALLKGAVTSQARLTLEGIYLRTSLEQPPGLFD